MSGLELCLQGENAAEAAKELAGLLGEALGQAPAVRQVQPGTGQGNRDAALILAVAAVALAIPGAVLAATDLVKRFKANDHAKVIIQLSGRVKEKYPGIKISVTAPAGATVEVTDMDPVDLVDMAENKGGKE
jgi:hypothetical protein